MKINLQVVKAMVEANTEIKVEIKETYLDFGAGLKHTTLIADDGMGLGGYQLLNPRETEEAQLGIITIEEVEAIIARVNKRGW